MPGQFSKSNPPRRPGGYFNWKGAVPAVIPPSTGSIVAIPFTNDWGPFKVPVLLTGIQDYKAKFGDSEGTPGYIAVKQAFQGSGVNGRFGAGGVLAYRTGGVAAAKASHVFNNTAGTPAPALTVTARYEGTLGNTIRITVQDTAGDSTKTDLIVFLNQTEVERFTFLDADIVAAAATINATSDWVTATETATGTALGVVSSVALTGGADGGTLTSGEWTALMSALEVQRFGVLAPFDLTDASIITSLLAWAQNLNANGKRFMTLLGGATDEAVATAITAAAALNDPNFMRIGVGHVLDAQLTNKGASPSGTALSTSQFVPRVAGALAEAGEARDITYTKFAGITLFNGPTEADMLKAFDGGVTVFSLSVDPTNPVHVERALTTFTTQTDPDRPYKIFREPRYLRVMHGIEVELTEWAAENIIGVTTVNENTRSAAVTHTLGVLTDRENRQILQAGKSSAAVDQDPPPSDDDDFIGVVITAKFGRSALQVRWTATVG
jgi:hypothetical protein